MTREFTSDRSGSGKVVNMQRFRNDAPNSPLRQAEAYWNALREGEPIPRRSQVDPRGLENILGQTFIVQRIAPGIGRFRLAGRDINALAGMEVRGMPISALFTPKGRKVLSAVLENMFETPAIAELSLATQARFARSPVPASMILLPLRTDTDDVSRALGVLACGDISGTAPVRFDVTGQDMRPVVQHGFSTETPLPDMADHLPPGMAEAPRLLSGRAPHLRLVKSEG